MSVTNAISPFLPVKKNWLQRDSLLLWSPKAQNCAPDMYRRADVGFMFSPVSRRNPIWVTEVARILCGMPACHQKRPLVATPLLQCQRGGMPMHFLPRYEATAVLIQEKVILDWLND